MKSTRLLFILVIGTLLLSACGSATLAAPTPDVMVIRTEAAQTIIAGITATANAVTPTPEATATPEFTLTPEATLVLGDTATPLPCDQSSYNPATVDVNVIDGTVMTPGQDFIKTWKVKNTGSCTWSVGYSVVYADYSDKMNGQAVAIEQAVAPSEEVEVSVQFKAPTVAGEYLSAWRMSNPAGAPFGEIFFVKIIVK